MSSLDVRPTFASTSAAGAMFRRQVREPVLVGLMLVGLGTSTVHALPPDVVQPSQRASGQTTAGTPVPNPEPSGLGIGDVRRLSGLTWEQLARLLSVSRRTLHFWASGKPMTPGNEEHLQRLLGVLQKIDRGSSSANRAMLLGSRDDGAIPLDLLRAGDYDDVLRRLGFSKARRRSPSSLSEEARLARAPRSPVDLVGALQDRIHRDSGPARAAKSVRTRSAR